MAINRSSIQAQDISTNPDVSIEFLMEPPLVNVILDPPKAIGKLYGYYDQSISAVRLYVIDPTGTRYLQI